MKKLLILMILCVATSVASAGLYTWVILDDGDPWSGGDVLIGSEITLTIGADGAVAQMLATVLNISDASNASAMTVSNPGDWTVVSVSTVTASGNGYNANFSGATGGVPAGNAIYSLTFDADTLGTLTIDATGGNWGGLEGAVGEGDTYGPGWGLPYAQLNVVPEPMTLALLGLGGLCLRRRKK